MSWLIHILVNSVVLMVVAGYFDSFYLSGLGAAILASMILFFLNLFVKPILVLLTLPVTIFTMGLFLIVINAITLLMTARVMGKAFEIAGFGSALLAVIVISLLNMLIQKLIIARFRQKRPR